ncbi:MAG: sulfotransferase domain-containing protein [Nitriliruptorales bacterium]|nr:sulfotransferase domain-containing protein [Nitriliruptorales bacterium]
MRDHTFSSLVIVGPPKAATTTVARWFEDRDDFVVAFQKEVQFLDRHWERGFDWYRDQFESDSGGRIRVDATPTYFAHPSAPERARELTDTLFLAILRDPVERAWSHHWFAGRSGASRPAFDEMVASEVAAGFPEGGILVHGLYGKHVDRWTRSVGRERLMIVSFDDVATRPQDVFTDICARLGVTEEPVPKPVGTVQNASHRLRSPRLNEFMLKHHLWRRLPGRLGFLLDELNRRKSPNPPMPTTSRRRLRAAYANDLEHLRGTWTPEKLPAWALADEDGRHGEDSGAG